MTPATRDRRGPVRLAAVGGAVSLVAALQLLFAGADPAALGGLVGGLAVGGAGAALAWRRRRRG